MPSRPETPREKAARYLREGKFTKLHDRIYACDADNGVYLVTIVDQAVASKARVQPVACTCPAHAICSHLIGANALVVAWLRGEGTEAAAEVAAGG